VFLVNVPIGAALVLAGARLLPAGRGEAGRGLDLAGLALLIPAVLAAVIPLVLGQPEHWPAWGWLCLAGSGVLLAGFALAERRLAARGGSPLVHGRILRLPGVRTGIVALFIVMTVFGGMFFALALHFQGGLGDSPLRAGLTFVPAAAAFAIVSLNWQRLPARIKPWLPIGGFAGMAAGLALLAAVLRDGGSGGPWPFILLALTGASNACAFSPVMTGVLMRVPVGDAADATGVVVTVNQLALVIGVASFGAIYLNLAGTLPAAPDGAFRQLSAHAVFLTCLALAALTGCGGALAAFRAWSLERPGLRAALVARAEATRRAPAQAAPVMANLAPTTDGAALAEGTARAEARAVSSTPAWPGPVDMLADLSSCFRPNPSARSRRDLPWLPPSRPRTCGSGSARPRRSRGCTCACRPAVSSASSGPTARARPRRYR
jgi:hypothetical protein